MSRYQRKWRMGRKGLLYSLALCAAILAVGGLGFWALEPQAHTLGDGLWLAFTTAATVGYGDIVPSTHVSRAFSVVVVLLGLAVLSLVTASVAAILVEVEERKVESDLLHELRSLRAEVQDLRRVVSAQAARPAPGVADRPSD
ncbi:MAG: potassium channel family protein [Rhodoferax sp.]|nr:potassium channel family protein [Rhodoferax sp.]